MTNVNTCEGGAETWKPRSAARERASPMPPMRLNGFLPTHVVSVPIDISQPPTPLLDLIFKTDLKVTTTRAPLHCRRAILHFKLRAQVEAQKAHFYMPLMFGLIKPKSSFKTYWPLQHSKTLAPPTAYQKRELGFHVIFFSI